MLLRIFLPPNCDGLFGSGAAFRMPAKGRSDPEGIGLNLFMIFHCFAVLARAGSWKME
jgi:hypothetical protein